MSAFAEDLMPHLSFAPSLPRDAREEVARRMLSRYLGATVALEIEVISVVALALGEGALGLTLIERQAALAIAEEERQHAEGARSLAVALGLALPAERPLFARRLSELTAACGSQWTHCLFAALCETLLSRSLTVLARDAALDERVRRYVADHAREEGAHAAFFGPLLAALWEQMGPDRDQLGPLVPGLLSAWLDPDLPAAVDDLRAVGLPDPLAQRAVAQGFPPARLLAERKEASRASRYWLVRAGALTHAPTLRALSDAGLC